MTNSVPRAIAELKQLRTRAENEFERELITILIRLLEHTMKDKDDRR